MMMRNKSTLAKLLSEEDIFVVHKQMETAYFNPKARELGLPIWKNEEMTKDIYDLMVCHEIGHALWTPLDMLEKAKVRKINHSFVNIIEDARIEGKVKTKYPGSVSTFKRGYTELEEKNFFGTEDKEFDSFGLIDRINLFYKSGKSEIPFSEVELPWVKRVAKCVTPDDVLDLAEELYKFMEDNPESRGNESSDEDGENALTDMGMPDGKTGEGMPGDENSEGEKGNADNGNSDDTSDDNSTDSDSSNSNDTEKELNNPSEDTESKKDSTVGGIDSSGKGEIPKAETDTSFAEHMDKLRDKNATENLYGNIPKVDLSKIIISHKKILDICENWYAKCREEDTLFWTSTLSEITDLKENSKKTVAYMVKEFEMKKAADQYARASTSKTGTLDMNKLHTYKYNEDLFRKITTLPGATNHGLVMIVDWSGSMSRNLRNTIAQLLNLIWFCRRANIPFEVYAFTDHYDRSADRRPWHLLKYGDLLVHSFNLLNFFSSNMSLEEEAKMSHYLWMISNRYGYRDWDLKGYPYRVPDVVGESLDLGGTPLNDTIIALMELVPKFKKETGIQKVHTVLLTDGASNSLEGVVDYRLEDDGSHTKCLKHIYGGWDRREGKFIITDPVINKKYEMEINDDITDALLKILKNRVDGMNIVGFFIAGEGKNGRISRNTLNWVIPEIAYHPSKLKAVLTKLRKDKVVVVESKGYDEYYLLPGGKDLVPENETLSDDLIGAGKGKLKTAFGKMQKGKINSRVLLNRFIKMVA